VIAPEWVAVSGFGRRRSLSDLAVWGFPEFSRKIFPLKPFFPPPNPFFSPRSPPPIPPPSKPSLQLSSSGLYQPSLPSYPPFSPPNPFLPPQGPYRTLSEHLRNPSIGSPKRPKITLFRPF